VVRAVARWRAVLGVVPALAAVALVAASCAGGGGAEQGPVKLGVEGPLTGSQAAYGTDMLNAVRLAVDEVNAAGGVLGRRVEIVQIDDQAEPRVGVDAAQRAIGQGVYAVIGPFNSSVGVAVLPVYLNAGVIPIHLTSNQATNRLGFTVVPKDYQIGPTEAKAITEYFRARRVAIVYDTSTYTAGIALQLRDALVEQGVQVVAFEGITAGERDYTPVLTRVKAANPDLYYVSTYYPEGGLMAKQAAELEVPGTCFMGLAVQDPSFPKIAGLSVAQACYSSGVPSAEQFPRAGEYLRRYRETFGTAPGAWGTFAYDSAKLLFDAVRRAGTWGREAVTEALSTTKGFEGITGDISIDPVSGNRVEVPVVILRIDAEGNYVIDPEWAKFAGFGA
jgi:branched-chain amino acid transport system substrate-binding protein